MKRKTVNTIYFYNKVINDDYSQPSKYLRKALYELYKGVWMTCNMSDSIFNISDVINLLRTLEKMSSSKAEDVINRFEEDEKYYFRVLYYLSQGSRDSIDVIVSNYTMADPDKLIKSIDNPGNTAKLLFKNFIDKLEHKLKAAKNALLKGKNKRENISFLNTYNNQLNKKLNSNKNEVIDKKDTLKNESRLKNNFILN